MMTLFPQENKFTSNQKLLALSWRQPYAELMLHGKIETRTWSTKYRGWVLICASKKSYSDLELWDIAGDQYYWVKNKIDSTYLEGVAIAIGRLVDCRPMRPTDEKACFVKYFDDLFCHIYEDVIPIEPIPWRGSQGWKEVDLETKKIIESRLCHFFCFDEDDGKPRCKIQCPFCEKI